MVNHEIHFQPKYMPLDPSNPGRFLLAILPCLRASLRTWGLTATARSAWGSINHLAKTRRASSKLREKAHPDELTLLTFSIHPELALVWYQFACRFIDPKMTKIKIVDCAGLMSPRNYPNATIQPFCNFSHARKLDYWVYYDVQTPYVWLQDDDIMVVRQGLENELLNLFHHNPHLAVISLQPRGWSFKHEDRTQEAMGTYSICLDRRIFVSEKLSFSPMQSSKQEIGRKAGYYDTADYANEQLLSRGYEIQPYSNDSEVSVCGFVGTSVTLLSCLKYGNQYSSYLSELIKSDPQQASYYLVGLFCNWKIYSLCQYLDNTNTHWHPEISEQEISALANRLPELDKRKTTDLFDRYQKHHDLLYSMW